MFTIIYKIVNNYFKELKIDVNELRVSLDAIHIQIIIADILYKDIDISLKNISIESEEKLREGIHRELDWAVANLL